MVNPAPRDFYQDLSEGVLLLLICLKIPIYILKVHIMRVFITLLKLRNQNDQLGPLLFKKCVLILRGGSC
jgi:hypothetical protein